MYFVWSLLILLGIALFFGIIILIVSLSAKNAPKDPREIELDEPIEELPIEALDVTVLELRCGVKIEGIKQPTTVRNFEVTFLTDDGEKLKFYVSEELYLALSEGERGSLALLNGQIYDYVSGNGE